MQISAKNLGKKFSNEWIFRNLNYEFQSGESYTFVGANGSGKSTLLQVLSGFAPHSEGEIHYQFNGQNLEIDNYYKHLVIAAPYLELIEDFTLSEIVDFHIKFKPFKNNLSVSDFTDFIELPQAKNKAVKFFSSGMKQRVKLGLAFWSDSEILMLDEPSSNLDIKATEWYLKNVQEYAKNRMLIICSNQPNEYEFCNNILNIQEYK
ncbi:ABC-type multidrug transport system ATPase subunit [Arcicella aurantiaca]|uniref:ABC-type multidrug transport system ATPase subunit n=1 Tax=Arcicella aurantiaca TaxID=591202 RepID=A0A316F1B3_9BACT|nr:ATP-binding cassette domain-containing protein [Arcicella aurantiaca]PWK29419.1 ABC-type multidrug transport system ATPase subunit [Arcicella aurantiaca]